MTVVRAIIALLLCCAVLDSASAADVPAAMATPVSLDNIDQANFSVWMDGTEKPCPRGCAIYLPQCLLWSMKDGQLSPPIIGYGNPPGMPWGESKNPGPRHLRIGFKSPVLIGSVLVKGQGRPSVLKPDAKYPGDLNDESQWISAQRIKDGQLTSEDTTELGYAMWALPAAVSTQALRFTHEAKTTDGTYQAKMQNAFVFSGRFANIAPQGQATTQLMGKDAPLLINETDDRWLRWWNIPEKDDGTTKALSTNHEWVMLTWDQPRTIQSLAMLIAYVGSCDVQAYTGPADKSPGNAPASEWKTVRSGAVLTHLDVNNMVNVIDLDGAVTTRAIRIAITSATTPDGRRIGIDELMALQPLKDAGLETALATPVDTTSEARAPIAVNFELPEDGNVTLVIDDADGKRVRNLIADTPFTKGKHTIYWDGSNDLARDVDAANHGIYNIPPQLVAPGTYAVRGLWHPKISLKYEMSVYAPGNPPWSTQDGTGGWMTTHTPARSVCYIPPEAAPHGKPEIVLGCYISEGGSALSWLDLDGNKLGGRGWVGGNWTGAQFLARDNGPNAVPGIYVYVGATTQVDTPPGAKPLGDIRLTGLTANAGDKPVLPTTYTFDLKAGDNLGGLAVYNGLLVFSQPSMNQLVFVDAKNGKVIGIAPVPNPKGLAFDPEGRLLVLSEKKLLRFRLGASPIPLASGQTVASDLDEPNGITVDAKDVIYISIRGKHNQVLAYAPEGVLLKTFGRAGTSQMGYYDPNRMSQPAGIAVDSSDRLWVTEEDVQPKRVSVWNKNGTLWKAFYGAQVYGGGGALDPKDANRFSYMGMEFHLDWKKGESMLKRIYYRADPVFQAASYFQSPELALHFNGRRYMTNAYNSNPTNGPSIAFVFRDKGDVVVPAAAMGRANDWPILKSDPFRSVWPQGVDLNGNYWDNLARFSWNDLNGDGQVQPNEVTMVKDSADGVSIAQDGSFLISTTKAGNALRFKPIRFTQQGVPIYDIKGEVLAKSPGEPPWDGGDQILLGTDGWLVQTTAAAPYNGFGLGGSKNGVSSWGYPSLWPGLHPSHTAPVPDQHGELVGTTRVLGDLVTPKDSDVGPVFFINSNESSIHVFTQDGLYVAQLFADSRNGSPRWSMPVAKQGMDVTDVNIGEENFFPTVNQVSDGSIHIMTGGIPALVKVEGLEKIQRIPPKPITVTTDDLKLAEDFVTRRELARQAKQGTGILQVSLRDQAPTLDEGLKSWNGAAWATIDERGVAAYFDSHTIPYHVLGAMTVASGKLVAAWNTGDPDLLKNSGEIPNAPFKTGGALDLMIGTNSGADPQRAQPVEGDLRLLITQVKGATKAVLYRAVVPGTPETSKVPFSAPWHSISLDSVTDVSDKVQLSSDGKGNYEVVAPLDLLGLNPTEGTQLKGDIGILRGDGVQTSQRVYWNNKATSIVSDVPSEAMLTPDLWGTLKFQKE